MGTTDWRTWHLPLSRGTTTLAEGLAELARVGADQDEIPFIVQLMENPRYDIPGLDLIHGAVDLVNHDCIHLVLGRGLLQKDEAFVIGFTMGSTRKVSGIEETLFTAIAKHLYPGIFRFDDDDVRVFRDAVRLAWISACRRLDRVDFTHFGAHPLGELRAELGIETDLLASYYRLEAKRHPDSPESLRLLD
ncbi:conserved hypothetical protein [Magnetospirillum sp. LM-5]|uniref:hypothetical protein n=1 Tax=Magnetospirillum sp. LM-5 TaxID=2681466 RepID=UPI00137EF963|nr:hypothetical protein [Magnetospirillum sp. LM-5]CAA7625959.1 conserved hypothetical protein [Magnetospirillum sp. LM-5]